MLTNIIDDNDASKLKNELTANFTTSLAVNNVNNTTRVVKTVVVKPQIDENAAAEFNELPVEETGECKIDKPVSANRIIKIRRSGNVEEDKKVKTKGKSSWFKQNGPSCTPVSSAKKEEKQPEQVPKSAKIVRIAPKVAKVRENIPDSLDEVILKNIQAKKLVSKITAKVRKQRNHLASKKRKKLLIREKNVKQIEEINKSQPSTTNVFKTSVGGQQQQQQVQQTAVSTEANVVQIRKILINPHFKGLLPANLKRQQESVNSNSITLKNKCKITFSDSKEEKCKDHHEPAKCREESVNNCPSKKQLKIQQRIKKHVEKYKQQNKNKEMPLENVKESSHQRAHESGVMKQPGNSNNTSHNNNNNSKNNFNPGPGQVCNMAPSAFQPLMPPPIQPQDFNSRHIMMQRQGPVFAPRPHLTLAPAQRHVYPGANGPPRCSFERPMFNGDLGLGYAGCDHRPQMPLFAAHANPLPLLHRHPHSPHVPPATFNPPAVNAPLLRPMYNLNHNSGNPYGQSFQHPHRGVFDDNRRSGPLLGRPFELPMIDLARHPMFDLPRNCRT